VDCFTLLKSRLIKPSINSYLYLIKNTCLLEMLTQLPLRSLDFFHINENFVFSCPYNFDTHLIFTPFGFLRVQIIEE
jgi:hypothetical protein